jgi:hypothetical protein
MSEEQQGPKPMMDIKTLVVIGLALVAIAFAIRLICYRTKRGEEILDSEHQVNPSNPKANAAEREGSDVAIEHTEPHNFPTVTKKEDARNKLKECRECATLCVEVLALIGLAIYAFLTYFSTIATQTAANAAKSAADTASAQLVLGQRPWVGPSSTAEITLTNLPSGPHFEASVEFKNFGPSAAFHVIPMVERSGFQQVVPLLQINDGSKSALCQVAELRIVNADKAPSQFEYGFPMYPQVPTRAGAVARGVIPMDDHAAVYGCVAYVDQLHTSLKSPIHHSWFCYATVDTLDKLVIDVADKTKYPDGKKVLPTMNCNFYQGAD